MSTQSENRLIFSGGLGMRSLQPTTGIEGYAVDGTSLSFMVEELVSLACTNILIPHSHPAAHFTEQLPPLLAKRVRVIDCRSAYDKAEFLLKPLANEFEVEFDGVFTSRKKSELHKELATIFFDLPDLLKGIEHQAQIDIDVFYLRDCVRTVRLKSRSSEARAILATIEGVLSAYRTEHIDSLVVRAVENEHLNEIMEELVSDAEYHIASRRAHELGIIGKMQAGLTGLRDDLSRLARRSQFKKTIDIGGRAIQLGTGISVPTSEDLKFLSLSSYLPPIVNLASAHVAARKSWQGADLPPIFPNIDGIRRRKK